MGDTAVEMNETEPEKHIQEMFSRKGPIKVDGDVKASDEVEDHLRDMFASNDTVADDIQKPVKLESEVLELSRPGSVKKIEIEKIEDSSSQVEDNSVKDVSELVDKQSNKTSNQDKENEKEPVKVMQKNGSKH